MAPKEDANKARERKEQKVKTYLPRLGDGQWQMDDLIGKGGNASVFRVYRGSGRNKIEKAVKLISIDTRYVDLAVWGVRLQRGEISLEEYQKNAWNALNDTIPELRFMAMLSASPNVLAYEDYLFFETEEDHQWNVMILMDMLKPLNQHLTRPGASQLDVLQMWRDMGMVLQLCAQFSVLHLDIKDANILVTEDGRYKLIDWGQACYRSEIVRLVREHKSVRKGTESYMAPEVFNSNPPVAYDERADQYSLGLVAYYYFNNMRLPFADKPWGQLSESERTQIKQRRVNGMEPLPRPEGLAEDIWQVLQRTCAHQPAHRYSSAAEMVHAIDILIAARAKKTSKGGGKGLMLGLAAALVVAGTVGVLMAIGGDEGAQTPVPPSVTAPKTATAVPETPVPETPVPETPVPVTAVPETPTPTPSPTFTPAPTPTPEITPTPTPSPTPTPTKRPAPAEQLSVVMEPVLLPNGYLDLRQTDKLTLTVSGEADREVVLWLNGEKLDNVMLEAGGCIFEFDTSHWPQHQPIELRVHYAESDDDRLDFAQTVLVDREVESPVLTCELDAKTTFLTGTAEPNGAVYAVINHGERYSGMLNEDGEFRIDLPLLKAGDTIEVIVEDIAGNQASVTEKVREARDTIALDELPAYVNPAQPLLLSGRAAANAQLNVQWSVQNEVYEMTVPVAGNGTWQCELDCSRAQNLAAISIQVNYADRQDTSYQQTAQVKAKVLAESMLNDLSIQPALIRDRYLNLKEGSKIAFSGQGEPDLTLIVLRDGQEAARTLTDARGRWSVEMDTAAWPQNEEISLVFHYEMDTEGRLDDSLTLIADTETSEPRVLDPLNENTEILQGVVEQDAIVTAVLNGQDCPVSTSGGTFIMSLPMLHAGDTLVLTSTDEAGNTASKTMTVEVGSRDEIRLNSLPDVIRPQDPLAVSGHSAANREVLVQWTIGKENGETVLLADADGAWAYTLDCSSAQHLSAVRVTVGYADGKTPELNQKAEVSIDAQCALDTDSFTYTEQMTRIAGNTDPGARVILQTPDARNSVTADGKGQFVFDNVRLTAGSSFELIAEDGVGNTTQLPYSVQAGERAQITVELPEAENGYLNAQADQLTVRGAAQAELPVLVTVAGREHKVMTAPDGTYELILSADALQPGEVNITAAYADGFCAECAASAQLERDVTPPEMVIDKLMGDHELECTEKVIAGYTDPGAMVTINVDGREKTRQADAEGSFAFEEELIAGQRIMLTAEDGAGNLQTMTITVTEEVNDVRIHITRPEANERIVNGAFGAKLAILQNGSSQFFYRIEQDGQTLVESTIAGAQIVEMRASEKAKEEARYTGLKGYYDGYNARISRKLPGLPFGELILSVYLNNPDGDPVLLDTVPFVNEAPPEIDGVDDEEDSNKVTEYQDTYLTDNYAFGLDEWKTDTFAPSQVYMTAWMWRGNSTESHSLQFEIDGVRYTSESLKAAGGELEEVYTKRDVITENAGREMPDIKPDIRKAGEIIMLDLSFLGEGTHDLKIIHVHNTEHTHFASRRIKLSSAVEVQTDLIEQLKNQWK
ncbi:MAG: protein kinase [Clostridia bacterium]|nr:protein kinase [Clostridia bacterium]